MRATTVDCLLVQNAEIYDDYKPPMYDDSENALDAKANIPEQFAMSVPSNGKYTLCLRPAHVLMLANAEPWQCSNDWQFLKKGEEFKSEK